jgi:putative restriction endonuclease
MWGILTACIAQFANPSKSAASMPKPEAGLIESVKLRADREFAWGNAFCLHFQFTFSIRAESKEPEMPALPQHVLRAKLRAALPEETKFANKREVHPAVLTIPGFGAARIYLWTVTHVESSDRPEDEFKIQLILPGQLREARGALVMSRSIPTFLMGYSPDFGVFVGWETRLHADFSFSTAVQVKEETLEEARNTGWAVASPRRVRGGLEVRVVFTAGNVLRYLRLARDAERKSVYGIQREAFFLTHTPNIGGLDLSIPEHDPEGVVAQVRGRLATYRLERDRRFGPMVKRQYDYACAVCSTQLEIVEGAHVIPANEKHGEDKIWNGVALCPNHHKLFDANTFVIASNLRIRVDHATLEFFKDSGRGIGVDDLLLRFNAAAIKEPAFFKKDGSLRSKMRWALRWREDMAGI